MGLLKHLDKGLIIDGLFSMTRNPNYLGEIFIYGAFAAFAWNHPTWWWSWSQLLIVWTLLFYPSWLAKDRSMSRYKEWSRYTSNTGAVPQVLFWKENILLQ